MSYTKENFKKELEITRQWKKVGTIGDYGKGILDTLEKYENLILCEVGCSEPKEIPKTLTFEGKNYVSKQAIKELIEKGELILV